MKEDKRILRKGMLDKLAAIAKPQYEHLSWKIAQALFKDPHWIEADCIGITISKPPEADTYQIIRRAWEEGKKVVIPKCLPEKRELVFRTLTHFNQLESVYYGLFEPIEEKTKEIPPNNINLLIVPGIAYTKEGYRLGFGGGYYDRFLTSYKGKTLSLAFHTQIVQDLPVEVHDLPVERIITDKDAWNTK